MKNLFIYIVFILLGIPFGSSANNTPSLKACTIDYLTAYSWEMTSNEYWQFEQNGHLIILNHSTTETHLGTWDLVLNGQTLSLSINIEEQNHVYTLQSDCSTPYLILANDVSSQHITLRSKVSPKERIHTLSGDWQEGFNTGRPFISLNEDGQYITSSSDNNVYQLETGKWFLIGDILVLFSEQQKIEAMNIEYLQIDEMVISTSLAQNQHLFLNKI